MVRPAKERLRALGAGERTVLERTARAGSERADRVARARALLAVADGQRFTDAARWLEAFAAGGVGAVADAPRAGRPPRAVAAYLAALERAADTPPRTLGVLFDAWTSDRLSAYLAETTGVRLAPGWVRALLARRRSRLGRPKHALGHLQDAAARAACEQELLAVSETGAGGRQPGPAPIPG